MAELLLEPNPNLGVSADDGLAPNVNVDVEGVAAAGAEGVAPNLKSSAGVAAGMLVALPKENPVVVFAAGACLAAAAGVAAVAPPKENAGGALGPPWDGSGAKALSLFCPVWAWFVFLLPNEKVGLSASTLDFALELAEALPGWPKGGAAVPELKALLLAGRPPAAATGVFVNVIEGNFVASFSELSL